MPAAIEKIIRYAVSLAFAYLTVFLGYFVHRADEFVVGRVIDIPVKIRLNPSPPIAKLLPATVVLRLYK